MKLMKASNSSLLFLRIVDLFWKDFDDMKVAEQDD